MRIFLLGVVSAAILQSPTELAIARMTPAQRVHAELYTTFSTDTRILDSMVVIERMVHVAGAPIAGRSTIAAVTDVACTVDAVFVGQVTGKTTMPTRDGTFLFTDYQVDVTDVVRPPRQGTIPARAIVTRPGGFVEQAGHKVGISVSSWPLLTEGRAYMFFVKRVPETGAYQTPHSFLLEVVDGSMKSQTPVTGVDDSEWSSGIRPSMLRAAVAESKCGGAQGGAR